MTPSAPPRYCWWRGQHLMGLLELPWGCALSPRGALHGNPIPLTASLAGGRVVRAGTADIGLPGHRDADAGGSGGTSPEGASQVPRHYRSESSQHQACFPGTSWGQMWSHTAQRLPLLVCWGAPRGRVPLPPSVRGWGGASGIVPSQHIFSIQFSPQQHRARLSWHTSSTARTFTRKPAPSPSSSARG